jgi:hypothetical protein
MSCSRSAATSALDSTYLTCVVAVRVRWRVAVDDARRLARLAFATVCINKFRGRAAR